MVFDSICIVLAVAAALWARPWRSVPAGGPPWVWLALWALLPLGWSTDRLTASPLAQPLSGASLLMLLAGWPLAVLALLATAVLLITLDAFDGVAAVQHLVWLGLVPATIALAIGTATRRWLPHHLFVYVLVRGFFGTLVATVAGAWLALWQVGPPPGLRTEDLLIGRWLAAWGEAVVTGMLVAIFVAYRPHWLATYSDTLYLPRR
ncbi:MAG: hypothetical protein IT390_18035 [Nitrospira sp.]|nr:hypothetical protein [Nitrospira sp.]